MINALVKLKIDKSRSRAQGYRVTEPLASGSSDDDQGKNRRVQVRIEQRNGLRCPGCVARPLHATKKNA